MNLSTLMFYWRYLLNPIYTKLFNPFSSLKKCSNSRIWTFFISVALIANHLSRIILTLHIIASKQEEARIKQRFSKTFPKEKIELNFESFGGLKAYKQRLFAKSD